MKRKVVDEGGNGDEVDKTTRPTKATTSARRQKAQTNPPKKRVEVGVEDAELLREIEAEEEAQEDDGESRAKPKRTS
ncbi:hypothetical protein TSUD_149420 [Trifolium subterraneum]|uniref:Uncharacterized protein n=1 Tax=Trifolium subterraneum TaxID=3900 RepID=A0A2Z6MEQ8_TRISU|nr:hypothetical protein TSUD_149420 [Trifolium subterraneum]